MAVLKGYLVTPLCAVGLIAIFGIYGILQHHTHQLRTEIEITKNLAANMGSILSKSGNISTDPAINRMLHGDCALFRNLVYACTAPSPSTSHLQPFRPSKMPLNSQENNQHRMQSFHTIFDNRIWGGKKNKSGVLQASGAGSSTHYTKSVKTALHQLINILKKHLNKPRIKMLDVPCGDMQWMPAFLKSRKDVDYTGMEIVPELIAYHRVAFKNKHWTFVAGDIITTPLNGSYDIVFSRMMTQHLKTADVFEFLKKISESGSRFLLTTTYPNVSDNLDLDITGGRFRKLNFEAPPFSLKPPVY